MNENAEFEAWWRDIGRAEYDEHGEVPVYKMIAHAAWLAARQWRPIDSAPKDGTEFSAP